MKEAIVFLSQGCSANFGDGEQLARLFEKAGEKTAFDFSEVSPKAFCLNFCTVKGNASALRLLSGVIEKFPDKPLLFTGCIPPDLKKILRENYPKASFSTIELLRQNQTLIAEFLNGKILDADLKKDPSSKKTFSPGTRRAENHIGIINISEGCLDFCTFCSTRMIRGKHRSAPPEEIISEAKNLVESGCKELWLTGQDTSCYGFEWNTNLARLTQKLLVEIPGDYKIRLGMGNPRHLKTYLDEMLETYRDDRVYKFIHLPVQSGSDSVLKAMGRKHDSKLFETLAESFLTQFDDFTLSTDLIVGFPGETDEDFLKTSALLKKVRPSICNITRFVPRSETPAEKIKPQVSGKIKHERSARLAEIFQKIALENNLTQVGKEKRVLVEKPGHKKGTFIARDDAYRSVALRGNFSLGSFLSVKITGAEPFALLAEEIT